MKTRLIVLTLLASSGLLAQVRVGVGARFGYRVPAPVVMYAAPPAPLAAYVPPAPGLGYSWVGGYWYPAGARYAWHAGYWAHPPFAGARWFAPRYYGRRYYGGYWRR